MNGRYRERMCTSLLWGGVAAVGQYTAWFLSIIRRIHVRFADDVVAGEAVGAPQFFVDARGPLVLSKDLALTIVWVVTVLYALLVAVLVYIRPCLSRRGLAVVVVLTVVFAIVAWLAEPLWGVSVLVDAVVLWPTLKSRHKSALVTD